MYQSFDMRVLLNQLSLPQRLLSKALYPPTLGFLLLTLLTIWTIGGLMESKTAAVELTTTFSNTSSAWDVDSKSLELISTSFVKAQRYQINQHVTEYLTDHVYNRCRSAISSWNQSLSTSIHAQRIMYSYMLDLNRTITSVLYDKSKQINESLNALKVSGTSQLSVNYWFIDYLFQNVSTNSTKLQNLQLNFPVISNSTKLLLPDINANSFLSTINKLSNHSFENMTATAKVQNHKFSAHLASHCRVLTAVMVTTYVVCTLGICSYEWLKFRWETLILSRHVDLHFHPLSKSKEESSIKNQQKLYQFARQLVFTVNNTSLYWISNWIGARKFKEGKKWDRFVNIQWWIFSNTGHFLVLLLVIVVHWQIYVSTIHTYSNQLTALEKSQKQRTHNLTNISTDINNTTFYLQFSQECHDFELHVFQTLNNSIFNQLWSHNGTVNTTLNNVNDQMNKLVREVQVASPPQWNNLSLSNFPYPRLLSSNPNSTADSLSLRCLMSKAVARRQTTMASIDKNFLNITTLPRGILITQLHRWTITGLVATMVIFYLLGLTVSTEL